MKTLKVERWGITIIITYPEELSQEKLQMLQQDAQASIIRIRNKRDD